MAAARQGGVERLLEGSHWRSPTVDYCFNAFLMNDVSVTNHWFVRFIYFRSPTGSQKQPWRRQARAN